jgi:hypothetical protein
VCNNNNYSTLRKNTRKYQTSSATLKLIEMLWYQLSATYLVQHPQIIQPVALLKFRDTLLLRTDEKLELIPHDLALSARKSSMTSYNAAFQNFNTFRPLFQKL